RRWCPSPGRARRWSPAGAGGRRRGRGRARRAPRSAAGWSSRGHLRIETGDRVTGVDEVAVVHEPLGQYPGIARRDVDLVATAADDAERAAGGEPAALGGVD